MRKQIENIVDVKVEYGEHEMREVILAEIANPSREFTDAFLNAWINGGFPCHSEVQNNHLRAEFAKAMAAAVEAIKREDA